MNLLFFFLLLLLFSLFAQDHFLLQYFIHHCSTSGNHRLESAGLNALEELLRYWEWTEKIVIRACVFRNWMFLDILPEVVIAVLHVVEMYLSGC